MGALITAAVIGATATIGSTVIASSAAGKAERRARNEKEGLKADMAAMKRQEVINPFEGITDLSSMIQDLSSEFSDTSDQLSNPYANLSVATQAAEFQAEEADISLANTLDTLMSTGASAGGATALAQAALQSKRGVGASIQQQEASNEKMRAQGEGALMQAKQAEEIRMQNTSYGEGLRVQNNQRAEAERLQNADVSGREFVYGQTEQREVAKLNRLQSQITGAAYAERSAGQAKTAAITSGVRH